jgi:hypothetical protein
MEEEYADLEMDGDFDACLDAAVSIDEIEECTVDVEGIATSSITDESPESFQPETADAGDGFVRFAMPGGSTDVEKPLTGSRLLEHVEADLDDLSVLGVVDVRALLGDEARHAGELGAVDHALLTGERDGDREQLRLRVVLR